MSRYKRTWEKNKRRKPADVVPETGATDAGLAKKPAPQTQTQTQKETKASPPVGGSAAPDGGKTYRLEPVPTKRDRKPSAQERFLVSALEARSEHLRSLGLPAVEDATWEISRINKRLGFVVPDPPGWGEAYMRFLEEPHWRDGWPNGVPWPMDAFIAHRGDFQAAALREAGAL